MKFGKNLAVQQAKFAQLRYIDYKGLKKSIKRCEELPESLSAEIDAVNVCFSRRVGEIQNSLHAISPERSVSDGLREVMRVAEEVEVLRRFAVWNAVAVVKILKKQAKLKKKPVDVSAPHISNSEVWLSKQLFFSGSDFAELQASLESVAARLSRERLVELSGRLAPELQVDEQNLGGFFSCPLIPDERCPICLEKCIDAVELSSCGHRFCWKCVVLGPVAFAPGEYRLSRCSVCRNELPLDPTRNFKSVCSAQLEFLSKLVNVEGEAVEPSEEELFGSLGSVFRRPQVGENMQSEKNRQAIDSLDSGSGMHPCTLFCSLCCEPLLLEAVSTTPCKHHFHRVCLEKSASAICPLCETAIPLSLAVPRFLHAHLAQLGESWTPTISAINCPHIPLFPGGPCSECGGYDLALLPPVTLFGPNGIEMPSLLHEVAAERVLQRD